MRLIRSLFFGMRPIWTVGVPVFTLFFFLPYWFILCPIIWHRKQEVIGYNCSGNSPWLYLYWLVAAVVWAIVFSIAVYCWKPNNHVCDESDLGSDQYLLSSQQCKTPVPFLLTSLSLQHTCRTPTKKMEKEVIPLQKQIINGVDISCTQDQPTLMTIPSSRPSESEFTWDHEEISWLRENAETTFSSHRKSIPEPHIEMILDKSSLASSPQEPESEDLQQDFEFLGIEYRADYYQLTPTGSPPDSPSFVELSSTAVNTSTLLEMEDCPIKK